VEAMNVSFTTPLVEAVKGGAGGGGARLTPLGHEMLAAYRAFIATAAAAGDAFLAQLAAALPVPPEPKDL